MPYYCDSCDSDIYSKKVSNTHECIACGIKACTECNRGINSANVFICSPCANNIRKHKKILDEYLKVKVRTKMNEKSEISEVEQIIQSDKISQEKSQDDSQGLPLGQGTPMDGRKEEESGSYTHTDTDFDDDESEEEIDSDSQVCSSVQRKEEG